MEYGITLGTLGSTAAQTIMVTIFPIILSEHAPSAFWVGAVIGAEGLFALVVPFWVGALSDRLPAGLARTFGRRAFFLLVAAPIMVAAICIAPFLEGYRPLAGVALIFFAALHGYLTPLWALLVDTVPDERRGRVQGVRGALHSVGLAYALVGGGLLFSVWIPLPFVVAGALVVVTTVLTIVAAPREAQNRDSAGHGRGVREMWGELRDNRPAPWFLLANTLWNGAVDGIRPYFFIFATVVVGITVANASLALISLVAGLGAGSVVLGRLGDRLGRERVLSWGVIALGVGMAAGFFVRDPWSAVALLLVAGFGAAAVVALPYPLYAELIGDETAGRYTGLFVVTLGFGRVLTPLGIGAMIDLGGRWMPETQGYPLMWPTAGVLALAGAVALWMTRRARE